MVVVVPRRWLLSELLLGGDTIPIHTVRFKTRIHFPSLDNHFLYCHSGNSFFSSICIYLEFYHDLICSFDGDQGVVTMYVWLECICLCVIASYGLSWELTVRKWRLYEYEGVGAGRKKHRNGSGNLKRESRLANEARYFPNWPSVF